MEKSRLDRFEIEKLANALLPKMLYKAGHTILSFEFESLGYCYVVDYKKNVNGHWEMFQYGAKDCSPDADVK
jgi:hypothetical protein